MPKETIAVPTTPPESTEATQNDPKISESSNIDKPKTLIVSTPPPASSEAENEPTANERASDPVTPSTPTPAGGMFSRLRKVWQGAEPKVHELIHALGALYSMCTCISGLLLRTRKLMYVSSRIYNNAG